MSQIICKILNLILDDCKSVAIPMNQEIYKLSWGNLHGSNQNAFLMDMKWKQEEDQGNVYLRRKRAAMKKQSSKSFKDKHYVKKVYLFYIKIS